MHSSRLSNDITRKAFWVQRLQVVEAAPDGPLFFDKLETTPSNHTPLAVGPEGYARTKAVMAVDTSNLQEAASMHHLSEDTLILAAWTILLRSYSGEDAPVSFGVCLDRERAAWLSTMSLAGNDSLLSAMRAAEQDMKLTMSHTLTFHSLGAFAEAANYRTIGTAVYVHSFRSKFPKMHLPSMATVFVNVAQGTMVHVHLCFRKDVLSEARAASVIDNFAHVLNVLTLKLRCVAQFDADHLLVNTIDTVSRNDYNRIVEFSAPLPLRLDDCVHDLVLTKCAKPDNAGRVAVAAWDGSFTYGELAQHVLRLASVIASAAHQLNARAEGRKLLVPFFLTKSKWTPVAILAILAAGGACVPLEPSHPAARRNDILSQLNSPIVLSNMTLRQTLADSLSLQTPVRYILCVDSVDQSSFPAVALPYVQPEDLCWIIFTSGSTGSPKGVKWQHNALATNIWEHGREFHMNDRSRVLQFASHVFDISVFELVTPLVHGGCVVIPSDNDRTQPDRLAKFMESMGVNCALFAASYARLLKPESVPTLRTLILGGESIGQDNIDKWTPTLDRFIIGYGSAETCINCAKNEFSVQTQAKEPWKESLGRAIGGRMLIADRSNSDKLVPIGAVGEIVVEGPILAQGYLHDDVKTSKAFIENPAWVRKTHFYPASSRRRFYRTGDLGRQAMDGSVSFVGRADFQVKIRGQRMELDEVRFHVVKAMPEAVDVHVDVVNPEGEKALVAFLSFGRNSDDQKGVQIHHLDQSQSIALRAMMGTLREKLPAAAVPSFFIPTTSFPYLVSGKVDRKQLLDFANRSSIEQLISYSGLISQISSEVFAPGNSTEELLLSCCREILKLPSLGPDDNFLTSGGDSISAIKVASAARDYGVSINVADLFNAPTIRALARVATGVEGCVEDEIDIPVALGLLPRDLVDEIVLDVKARSPAHDEVLDVYPCTPLQEALITASSIRSGAYVARHTVELPVHVDLHRFKAAWSAVIQRHDILRTRIFESPHGAIQVVYASGVPWYTGSDLGAYCEQDRSLPMGFGDSLVRLGLVGRAFIFTIHHSLFDGWSITRLFEDVEREYAGLDVLEVHPYKLYIQHLSRLDTESPRQFWATKLASDRGLAACHFPQTLSSSVTPAPDSEVKMKLAVADNAKSEFTLPTRIRAAWALLMGRYLDSQDVIFGETFSGRSWNSKYVQAIAGPTISTAPVRITWDVNDTIEAFLRTIQSDVLQFDAYGHLGVQTISSLSNHAAEACQFRHLIVIQPRRSSLASFLASDGDDRHRPRIGLEKASLDLREYHSYAFNMDFTLEDDGITVTTTFDSAVFAKQQIQHLQSQFGHVLNQICRAQDLAKETINGIDYASGKDREVQIRSNNRQNLQYERSTLIQALERHVCSQSTAPAVHAWDGSLNYRELDRGTAALANHLSAIGVRKGDHVPYCFPKSVWTTVSILGALRVGAIAIALEPSHPDSGILKILSQAKPKVVLCAPSFFSRIKSLGFRPFAVEENAIRSISQRAIKKRYSVQPNDIAFHVMTSGSTGEPKGIPLEHNAICIMAKKHGEVMNINKSSRIFQFAAHVFDVSIGDLAISLYHGACLCVPSDHDRMNNLASAINKFRANRAWLTPTVASLISPADCPTMEWLSVGGEQLTQMCKDIWDGVALVNVYGPAEVTNLGTAVRVSRDLPITNIGHANGTRVWICEPGNPQKLAPTGCIGEIVFEGPNVTQGYSNNPTLTEAAFPDILSWALGEGPQKPARMYRTGDLARLNVDGSIDFQGRRDTQIKLRGQRIEITAIETALQASIEEPVELAIDVLDRSGVGRDAFLLAFLHLPQRLTDQASPSLDLFATIDIKTLVADIRSKLSQALPPHMIPTLFIPLNRLPKLVSGKIDRKTLRLAAYKLTDEVMSSYKLGQSVAKPQPLTQEESAMRKLWASVLRLPETEIGMDDNFVSLGGDSITAIKLVVVARAQGLTISVATIFQHGTISSLCGSIVKPAKVDEVASIPRTKLQHPQLADIALQCDVSEDDIEDIFPTTALQEGMMMLTEKNTTAYIAHHVMPLPSWVETSVFHRAWQVVTDENAILRTRIIPAGLQVVLRPAPVQWTPSTAGDLSAYIRDIRQQKIGFGTALTRVAILQNPPRFVLTAHHSIYDGWSMGLLGNAITVAYKNLTRGSLPATYPMDQSTKITFHSFVDYIATVDKNQARDFWRSQLDGSDPAYFPPSLPSSYQPLADSLLERRVDFPRDPKSTSTSSTLIRAAWALLISAFTGSHTDVVFGASVTGRSAPLDGILTLIGPTLATVPFRVVLNWKEPIQALLDRVQLQSFAVLEFEQYGLQNIKKSVPSAAAACEFQSLLVVHPELETNDAAGQLVWSSERSTSDFLTNALTVECQPTGSQMLLTASYDSSIMDERQMGRMLSTFEHILCQLCQGELNKSLRLDQIDTVSPSDRAEIAAITKRLPPLIQDRVHDMFARQAAATPNALAVSAWDGDLTYHQLDELSDRLACHVRSLGVGPECFIPFAFEKSKWVPVTQLAILKAGGACCPLDPSQPLDRLQSIIETIEPKVVVTSTVHADLLVSCSQVEHFVAVSQTLMDRLPKPNGPAADPRTSSSNACYVIFTSGSTGTPKGVVWEHATLCSSMAEHGVAFNYATESRVLQFSSHTFDVSVSELLTTLVFGGCVCIPDDFTRLNGIANFMREKRINWSFFVPSFARLMDPASVPGLKTIVLGGEAPGKDNIERWSGKLGLELIVTYGPAESCIYCAKNSVNGPQIDGSIGHSIGGIMWIADLGRPTELAPIGAVGEIVIEGSILGRGYLKDPGKMASSFRPMPVKWANGRSSRVYYTGDLGRVNSDGTISCLGRRDDQVKIRGQRVELSDIEYHLRKDERVRQALVLYPRSGPCANHLVGILSMVRDKPTSDLASSADIALANFEDWVLVADIQDRLSQQVPVYMIPVIWIVLNAIPLMPASQKVNKKMVNEWAKTMDQATYEQIARLSAGGSSSDNAPAMRTTLEEQVRIIWSDILNVAPQTIGQNTSFLRVGGDSISAMQVVTRCRNEGIMVTVQDLLKSKTIADFCEKATTVKQATLTTLVEEPESETPFALSPIQKWFMALAPNAPSHFNQSHLLRFTQAVDFGKLRSALLTIIERHPMLRARFQQANGSWQQYISSDAGGSLRCRQFRSVWTMQKVIECASDSQSCLDITKGPLVAADLCEMSDGGYVLFITCHHLVIDLVSWRIVLQELEDILLTGSLAATHKPLSFRTWRRLLEEHAAVPGGVEVPLQDFGFWGISSSDNTAAQVVEECFSLDNATTELLTSRSNEAFNTEPLDLLLTAIAHSFNQLFRSVRPPVAIFNEGHGREPWRSDVDLSSTVGWFTSMCPILLSDHKGDVLRSLKEVKDIRRQIPEKGLSFFASFTQHTTTGVEITFNYHGLFQSLERQGALLNRMSWAPFHAPSDSAADVPRFSIFDISAGVEKGALTMNFAFNSKIRHRHLVHQWIEACADTLRDLVKVTSQQSNTSLTLSDLPHLRSTYDELSMLLDTTLPSVGVAAANVQDMYPCSPMQTALLVSQSMDPTLYAVRYVWEVVPKASEAVSVDRLVMAWKDVVKQHPLLRTVFVQSTSSIDGKTTSTYNQVVLKEFEPNILICEDDTALPVGRPEHHISNGPPHQMVLSQQASGKVLVQLDVSHTLIDGSSVNTLLDSFVTAYDGAPVTAAAHDAYGNYIGYLSQQDLDSSRQFWKTYLSGAEPCHFPRLKMAGNTSRTRQLEYLDFTYPNPTKLHSLCANTETTAASVYKLAWALLLRAYTGNNSPCFGYLASGRDLPIQGITEAVGPFINMLVCMIPLEDNGRKVEMALKSAHTDYANCLSHQLCSLAEIQRSLGLGGDRLFNTVMSVQRLSPPGTSASAVEFRPVHVEDPSEFDIALNIGDAPDFVDISLTYSSNIISTDQAKRLASTFSLAIDSVLDSISKSLRDVNFLALEDYQQILGWNSIASPVPVSAQCDHLISLHLASKADKPAVSGWDLSLTYSELDTLASTVARHLVSKYSITANTLVPFCFEKSAWTIVAMLGIMKAGAAFVPLDPTHPLDRLVGIAKRVRAPLVVCSEQNEHIGLDIGGNISIPYLVVGRRSIETMKASTLNRASLSPLTRSRNPSDVVYCLWTSGSSGMPKGVLIQHAALCSSASMHGRAFNYTAQARTLQFASYGFDACITEIFTTLLMGGCVCVPSETQRMDKEKLMNFVNEHRVNHVLLTPSVLALMDPLRVPSITTLLLGGEAANYQLIDKWRAPLRHLFIAYGPTECTVICAGHDVTGPDTLRPGKSSIGKSVGSVAWVCDPRDHNKLVPVGAIGELLVEGPILAQGYLEDEAKTNAVFVMPAWSGEQRRMYKTGDLVRYQEDGTMEYLGRRDNQVKLRGQRLELGEIEEQLSKQPDVQQCAVLLIKEGVCANKLVAVMTLRTVVDSRVAGRLSPPSDFAEGMDVMTGDFVSSTTADLSRALFGVLPSFMVPSCWIVASQLPLLASGKTDRRFLASCINNMNQEAYQLSTGQGPGISTAEEQDLSTVEKTIRQVWSTVLNISEQSINPSAGSFVKMGGDSISAMEVVAQCRGKGIPLLIEQLLKAKSVKQLAKHFDQLDLATAPVSTTAEISNVTSTSMRVVRDKEEESDSITMFGLSPIQRMFTRLSPGENHFNQSFLLKVSTEKARLTEDIVRQALDVVVKRHAMLRARFQKLGRTHKQWIEPVVKGSYIFQSWEMPASPSFPLDAAEKISQTQQALNLENGPVFAGDLFNVGDDQYLFLTAHHLVIDLVSWRIVLKDIEDYIVEGTISAYRSMSFERWCGLLNTHRKSLASTATVPFEVASPDYAYWGMAGKPNYASDFEHHRFALRPSTSQALLGPCNELHGTDSLDLFLGAVMHSFAATFQDRDIPPIYNEGHGREPWDSSIDLSRTVGWFTTIAPVWVDSRRCNKDILEYVKQVKDVRHTTPHKGFPYFSSLDFDRKPFNIEVSFNYFGSFQQLDRSDALLKQVHFRNIDVDPCEISEKHNKFALIDISAESENNQLVFTFSFNRAIGRRDEIQRWISNYQKSLEHMARVLGSRGSDSVGASEVSVPRSLAMQVAQNLGLKALGVEDGKVEDSYPCTPSQQGMLLSQSKDAEVYWFRSVYELELTTEAPVTFDNLRQAWRAVVRRHPVLRTIFVEQNSTDGFSDQLVLRDYEPNVIEDDVPASLSEAHLSEFLKIRSIPSDMLCRRAPQHQLRLARQESTGRVFCSFLLSHAIADGCSMAVILRDLSTACEARPLNAAKPLLKNYVDYIRSRDAVQDISFWKKSLEGVEPCFLPVEEQPLSEKVLHKAEVPLDKINYAKIISAARELGVSVFTLLQVTWALTLREYSNDVDREECCFGIVTSGRDLPVQEIGDIVGPLVNILVSRVALPHDQAVSQIAEVLHDNFIDGLAHQTSSLVEITHEVGAGTLFNTGMTLQKAMPGGQDSSTVSFRPMGGQDPTEFDMVVQALDDGRSLKVHLSYWCDKISDQRANNITTTFASILTQVVHNPDVKPVDLHVASDKDVQQLWAWNASLPAAMDIRIEEMIAQRTAENPEREALWSSAEVLSYQQLDVFSSRVAQGLLADVEREEVVPLCFEKSVWIVVAMLAVLKVGGTIVLMDPSHPLERLRSITGTVKAKRILASFAQADLCLSRLGLPTVVVSEDMFKRPSGLSSTAPSSFMTKRTTRSSADAAYVVFSSGSTGVPKGSVTEHRSFCTATYGYHQAIGQVPGERVLQFASYSFDASFLEILASLMVGATVCVPTERERSNQLVSFINRSRTTFACITPTVASLLEPEDVPTLRCLSLCGEPMTASHVSIWSSKIRLVNAFGPSECCVGSAANSFVTQQSDPNCIGKAVSCCYWVVHPRNHNRLARIGSIGELLIEGAILARHYLDEPARTAAAFISNPEWARPGRGTRLYKTGDLVYQNPDGSFQYVGRKDTQAKLRGQRLEFGDIEQAFRDVVPQTENVVAEIAQPNGQSPRLMVCFSAKNINRDNFDDSGIKAKLSQKIPAYMVPSVIVPLEQLPLMPSGKVDRKKIRALAASLTTRQEKRAGRLPTTEMEVVLASLWKDVMKSAPPQIMADDSFFQVGGDSYTAMRLVTAARACRISLNVAVIMQTPKLSDMAKKAKRTVGVDQISDPATTTAFSMVRWNSEVEEEVSRQCDIPSDTIQDVYPCTPLQEGLFVLSVKQAGTYVAHHCYELPRTLDLSRYRTAWNGVYQSNAILRTHIVQLDYSDAGKCGGLYQVVVNKPLVWHHASSLDEFTTSRPVSLGAPLTEFAIVEQNSYARYLVLKMHHAAYDATSLRMLFEDVETVYNGGQIPQRPLFKAFIKQLQDSQIQGTQGFWARYLHGAQPPTFPSIPTGYVPSADSSFNSDITMPAVKSKTFTASTMIRVAWAMVLSKHAETHDVVFGETLSGRNGSDDMAAEMQGPMITTLPVRCFLEEDGSIDDILSDMQSVMVEMIPHQHAGLQNIRLVGPSAAAACNFGCLVTIALESSASTDLGLGINPVDIGAPPAMSYPLSMQFILGEKGAMKVSVCYDQRLVDGIQVENMVAQFVHVLSQLCGGEKKTVNEVEVVADQTSIVLAGAKESLRSDVLGVLHGEIEDMLEEISSQELSKSGTSCSGVTRAQGDLEQEMKKLWADILRMAPEEVNPTDNFFQLGGDSISSMRLVTAAERKRIKITVADIFQHPTLDELCEFVAQVNTTPPQEAVVGGSGFDDDYDAFGVVDFLELERDDVVATVCRQLSVFPGDVEDVYPATDYQAWAVSHGLMRSRGNTNYFLFRLHGDLDTFRLEQACRKMVASNPILRTLFTTIRGQLMQVVLRSYQIEFLRHGSEHSADDNFIQWLVEQDAQRSACLSQSIVRFKLVLHADGHFVLIMRMSHAQYDGMSLPLLTQDLANCYNGQEPKHRPSFGNFIQGATFREGDAINFWGNLLEGSSMTEIVKHSGPSHGHHVDTIRTRTLPPIPVNIAGMSQATLVKAAWALVLAKLSGQHDVVFGNLIFGRNMPVSGIEDITGPCINIIPVRVKVDAMDSLHDLLALVQEQQMAAMPHENLGFRRLIKNCTDWPHWARFSTVVQHQQLGRDGAQGQEFTLGENLKCEMGVLGPAYDSADLWVQTTPHTGSFKVEIGSCSSVVQPAVAEMLLDKLCATLSILAAISVGNSPHLWELLARDGGPVIPIKSSIVDQVWSRVLPDADTIPWDTPYFEIWGDEIAPARFLEEYAEQGLHFDMEDILENPTKQAQMMLTSRVHSDKSRGRNSRDVPYPVPLRPKPSRQDSAQSAATTTTNNSGFWMLDSSSTSSQKSSRASSSRGNSVPDSPLVASPRMGVAGVLTPRRKSTMPVSGMRARKSTAPYPAARPGYSLSSVSSASSSASGGDPAASGRSMSWADRNRSMSSANLSPPSTPGSSTGSAAGSVASPRRTAALRPFKLPEYARQAAGNDSGGDGEGVRPRLRRKKGNSFPVRFGAKVPAGRW